MRFGILGLLEVADDQGRELALGGPRQRAVLAILLVHANEVLSNERLIDALWGNRAPRTAAKTIQVYVSNLRKLLGDGLLATRGKGYVFNLQGAELDADRFAALVGEGRRELDVGDPRAAVELLRQALGLWRGQALADFSYEPFAQPEIARLEEARLVALEDRVDAELALGEDASLVGELDALVREHPWRERLHAQLMLALYRAGRQADALEAYQHTRSRLAEELGLEPGPALQDLQMQILEQEPSLRLAGAGGPAGTSLAATLPSGTVTLVFTEIEGSARLLRESGKERYREELRAYRERVRAVVAAHRGFELAGRSVGSLIAFERASDALEAAGALQAAVAGRVTRVRIGVHTGEPLLIDGDYVGLDVDKTARICDAAHGGQVLVSQATRDLAGAQLRDLGEHRLRDLTAPERLFQLGADEFPPLRTLRPTNLPVQATALLGRHRELTELRALARSHRLVTLTGPGGSGKTRLALALATDLAGEDHDGVWWVPLAAVTDPGLVLPTIAQTMGIRGELRAALAGKRLVVLLDNLEQVLDSAPLIAELLAGLPGLRVIATSRERLAVSFEQEYSVPPLDEITAQELFVSRARQLEPSFQPDDEVVEICRRLDRLPLALELAATRVKLMSTVQMLERLERRLDLLAKGKRDAPDRQATMRATIGWSYDLLSEHEQTLFRQLGVFAGTFELEAAEAVCAADLDDLQSLIDKSLLRRDGHGRFFLLELTREYALEQLHADGETEQLGQRYAEWFLQLARRADEHLRSAEQGVWLARLDADTDNFRAVLAWCSEHDPAAAIELATTLEFAWTMHGRHPDLIPWLERALATPAAVDSHSRSRGLATLVRALWFSNQVDRVREPAEEGLVLCRELGDKSGEATALLYLGGTFWARGSVSKAIELQEAALGIWRDAGDRVGVERGTNWLGGAYLDVGDPERAAAMFAEALAIDTESGDRQGMSVNLGGLGDAELAKDDPKNAARHFGEALRISSGLGDERSEIYALAGLACAAALQGDPHSAGRLWGIAEAAENRPGMAMVAGERARYERIITALVDDQAFQAGYQAGRDIELANAVSELREPNGSD
jgi:predicted ATPase/DNA-binding SARP family transcriptional activator